MAYSTSTMGIAIIATINGIIAQMVMSSRVIYGLADRKQLPAVFARVNHRTRTPLAATVVVVVAVLLIAASLPLETLAEWTSRLTFMIFATVNAALVIVKRDGGAPAAYSVPIWGPCAGCGLCLALLAMDIVVRS